MSMIMTAIVPMGPFPTGLVPTNGPGEGNRIMRCRGGYDSEEDDFDYDEFLEKEFGSSDRPTPKPWWWYVAWVVLFVLVVGILVDAITLVYPRPS